MSSPATAVETVCAAVLAITQAARPSAKVTMRTGSRAHNLAVAYRTLHFTNCLYL